MTEIGQPLWSNQPVRPFVRFLAWVFISADALALCLVSYFSATEGVGREQLTFTFGMVALMLYSLLLVGRVALTGKAPTGWVPWK
jgi:hypothetical protein